MAGKARGELDLWMNGVPVGSWQVSGGRHVLTYAHEWLESDLRRPISLSLPLLPGGQTHEGARVEAFFENLLPDDLGLRRRLARRFGARGTRAFELLEHVGSEAAGALQILPAGETPGDIQRITGEPLTESDVAQHLRNVRGQIASAPSLAGFRISLAGAHAKTALLWHDGGWQLPTGATPSTHLLKPPLGLVGDMQADLSDSVENEWLSARIVERFGLRVAASRIEQFEDQRVLVVERFDRELAPDGSWWQRLPQEDACQALGISPDAKYEAEGGPGVRAMMQLLDASAQAAQDRSTFFTAQLLFWLLAAVDGHAKNFSLAIEPLGRFQLTPLYDILSALPIMGHGPRLIDPREARMAMALWGKNRHYHRDEIKRQHFASAASDCRLAGGAEPIVQRVLTATPRVLAEVGALLPKDFPDRVAAPILEGIQRAADRLEAMPPG